MKGRPIIACEYCSAGGIVGDIILADMSAYLIGYRGGVETDVSIHLRFDYNESAFRFITEIDGRPWIDEPTVPKNSSKLISPFVCLEGTNPSL